VRWLHSASNSGEMPSPIDGPTRPLLVVLVALMMVAVSACGGTSSPTASATASAGPLDPATTRTTDPVTASTLGSTTHEPTAPVTFTTTTLTFTDATRGTVARPPLPATDSRVLRTTMRVPDGTGPWPLVVFGHGYSVDAATYSALLDGIARAGFVVAAPEFPGSSSALPGRPDERDLQDEPCDLLLVASQVQAAADSAAEPAGALAGKVQPGAVGLAGQSDGATAAAFAALTSTCAGPPVGAVVAFSAKPAPLRPGFDAASAPALLAVTGSADDVNRPANTRALFDELPHRAWMLTSLGEDHLTPSTDSPHLPTITAVAVDVLRGALDHDPAAVNQIADDATSSGLTLESHP
jgi:dienelactone hydrolase